MRSVLEERPIGSLCSWASYIAVFCDIDVYPRQGGERENSSLWGVVLLYFGRALM